MKAAIIAAGKGERLAQGGVALAKPLVKVCNEPLISRVIRAAHSVDVTSIACIINELSPELDGYLRSSSWPVPLRVVRKTTGNSMESLFTLAPMLADEPFLLFTVDSVFTFTTLKKFLARARMYPDVAGALALTRFIDDEKPLWAMIDKAHRIRAIGEGARTSPYVTAGFYYLDPAVFDLAGQAKKQGLSALRQFLGLLLESGYALCGIPVSKTIDVDYPEDIQKAEVYLRRAERRCAP
jgi:NDP-sugar pyrophosphorylase family protein